MKGEKKIVSGIGVLEKYFSSLQNDDYSFYTADGEGLPLGRAGKRNYKIGFVKLLKKALKRGKNVRTVCLSASLKLSIVGYFLQFANICVGHI